MVERKVEDSWPSSGRERYAQGSSRPSQPSRCSSGETSSRQSRRYMIPKESATMSRERVLTTAKSVEALKPAAERYAVKDTQVSGLELRVYPDGTKIWTLRYRARRPAAATQARRVRPPAHESAPTRDRRPTRAAQGGRRDRPTGRTQRGTAAIGPSKHAAAPQAGQHRGAVRRLHRAAREAEEADMARRPVSKLTAKCSRRGRAGRSRRSRGATAARWCRPSPTARRRSTPTGSRRCCRGCSGSRWTRR